MPDRQRYNALNPWNEDDAFGLAGSVTPKDPLLRVQPVTPIAGVQGINGPSQSTSNYRRDVQDLVNGSGTPGPGSDGGGGGSDGDDTTGTPSWLTNTHIGAQIGLGLAGFLENRRTASLQRQALRHDIQSVQEHRERLQDLRKSWASGVSAATGGSNTPATPTTPRPVAAPTRTPRGF